VIDGMRRINPEAFAGRSGPFQASPQFCVRFDAAHGCICRLRDVIARFDDSHCLHLTY
jgi:hypothetical protein